MSKNKQDERLMNITESFIKYTWKITKKAMANMLMVRQMLKTNEKYLFVVWIIISYIFLVFNNLKSTFYFIVPFIYFFIKGGYQQIIENAIGIKYKDISKRFDQKVKVLEANKDKSKFKLYSYVPVEDIKKQTGFLEHYLNKEVESIERDPNNFRLIHVKTKVKSKINEISLNKIYILDDYLYKIKRILNYEIQFSTGVDEKGNILSFDLIKLTHTFIAGMQGGGKSNLLNVIIQSMMYFNDNVFFVMVDFKGGVELCQYEILKNTVIVENLKDFKTQLQTLEDEMEERYYKLKSTGVKKISQYNKKSKDKMCYTVLIIDEMSDIRLSSNSKLSDEIEDALTRIMNKGRAAGIIVIGATQRPSASQINTNIRDRFGTKFSARIKDKNTQKMAGIYGTENLKDGEFMMEYIEEVTKFKAFFIDELKNNKVYENLSNSLSGGVKLEKNI